MQAPTKPLADRYRFKQSLDLGAKSVAWIAMDEQTRREVVASALPTARVAALMGVVGLRHPHLASIVDVIHDPEPASIPPGTRIQSAGIVVAELIRGTSLHQALKQGAPTPRIAARWWVGLCDAVRSMHQAGGAHGAISPRSVVVQPNDGRDPAILTQLLAPSSGAYCAPERLQGRGPSTGDDVWALHASLFAALTGSPPFKGDTKDQLVLSMASGRIQQLSDFGIYEPELQSLLEAGLTADLARRRADVAELMHALEPWAAEEAAALSAGPVLHVPNVRDWEEDAATVVQDDAHRLAALQMGAQRLPIAPVHSVPPVPVPDDLSGIPDVADLSDDEDDATTVMHQPRLEEIEAAMRAAANRAAPALPAEPEEDPFPSPKAIPLPHGFDDEATVIDARAPAASEPPTAILERGELPIPPAPRPASFGQAPPVAPSPPYAAQYQQYQQYQAAPRPPEPPISAFPPPISRPPPAGPDLAQVALAADDAAVRKAGRGPLLVIFAILLLVAIGIAVAMFLNYRSAPMGRGSNDVAPPALPSEATAQAADTSAADPKPTTATTAPPSLVAAVGAATHAHSGPECVQSHFEPGSFKAEEKFDFLCRSADFRGITSQLHRRLVVAGVGKITPGMRQWSELGWYELAATAVVRASCCPAAVAARIELPKTGGKCEQLADALGALSKRPVAAAEITQRAGAYEKAVSCLFANGTPRPYTYRTRPADHQRKTFESFFQRAVERHPG